METEQDTSKMLLTVSSFGESLRRLSTGGGVFNEQVGILLTAKSRLYALTKKGVMQLNGGPKIRGACCARAPYFRDLFANCVSPKNAQSSLLAERSPE